MSVRWGVSDLVQGAQLLVRAVTLVQLGLQVGHRFTPAPQLFFAPSEVGRRLEQWGREAYQQQCADALATFVEGSRAWLSIDHRTGAEGAAGAS